MSRLGPELLDQVALHLRGHLVPLGALMERSMKLNMADA